MKKYLVSCMLIFVVLLGLGAPVSAMAQQEPPYVLSEDLQTIYYGSKEYSAVDTTELDLYWSEPQVKALLSEKQMETIKEVTLERNEEQTVIEATIRYHTGAYMVITYLDCECFGDYQEIMGDGGDYKIDFGWPENNVVVYDEKGFFGEQTVITEYIKSWGDSYFVFKEYGSLSRYLGVLFIVDNEYYYVDFSENQTDLEHYYESEEEFVGYRITDTKLLEMLKEAESDYYEEDIGFLYDDDLSGRVTAVMLCILFGAIPLGILIFCLIQAFRKTGVYKKMFTVISALSAAELTVFAVVTILISLYR